MKLHTFIILFLLYVNTQVFAVDNAKLIIVFTKKEKNVIAEYNKSKYTIIPNDNNKLFLMDQVKVYKVRPVIIAIIDGNINFDEFTFIQSLLNRFGYEELKIYLKSKNEKGLLPITFKAAGHRVDYDDIVEKEKGVSRPAKAINR